MAGAGFQVDLTGFREATTLLRNLNHRIVKYQLEEPLRHFGNLAKKVSERSFRKRQTPDGTPWAPISKVTYRLGKSKSSPPLVRTGKMRRSISATIIQRAKGPELIVQSNVPYADKHQLGDKLNTLNGYRAPIPARQFIGLGRQDMERIETSTARWLNTYVERPHRQIPAGKTPKRIL